jgi:anionic cell wall polymer biosynthesis LytR-Cps2A-Psr (LCP) family protein
MVKQIVDYMGGVDVVLKEPATDWVSGYTMQPGTHYLNGDDAIWLMRNRFNPQGDFFREGNQQEVLSALFEKFKKLSKADKISFFEKFIFKGDFLKNAQIDFAKLTPYIFDTSVGSIKLQTIVLDFTTKLFKTSAIPIQGQQSPYISVLIPVEGFEKYDALQKYIAQKLTE